MKKLSFFLMAMLMSVMSFAAEATATISFADKAQRTVYTTSQQVWEQNGIVVTNDKASSTSNVGDYANPARFYKSSKVTIQCTLGNIKKIEISGCGANDKTTPWNTNGDAVVNGTSATITPTSTSDTYTIATLNGQARAGQMVVTYEVSDEGFVATPAIEGEQYFKESATVSMKAAEGLKVYYTLDGTEPTTASTEYAAPFEVTETTTVKAIAHDGENASEVVTVVFKKMEVLTPSEAVALCTTTESADKYIIRGYVTKIATAYDAGFNNITFWLADEADGGEILQAYRAVPVTENDKTVAEGAYVEIVGKLVLFGSSKTPEVPAGGTYTIIPAPVVNHTITVSANPAEAGTVTGGGEFEETDEITVKAVANDGYEFTCWTSGKDTVSTANPYKFTVTADVALVANFKAVEPETITWELNGGELPTATVPTQEELWASFKTATGLDTKALSELSSPVLNTIAGLLKGTTWYEGFDVLEWKWLKSYIQTIQANQAGQQFVDANGTTRTVVELKDDISSDDNWRFAVAAFFAQSQYVGWPTATADFTEAGKPEAWGAAYQAAHAVVLPTEPVAEDYVLPTPVKTGYTFVGWYDNEEGTGEAYTVIPAGWSGTLYAIWKQSPATALENIAVEGKAVKAIINGQLIIINNGVQYNALGQVVK